LQELGLKKKEIDGIVIMLSLDPLKNQKPIMICLGMTKPLSIPIALTRPVIAEI